MSIIPVLPAPRHSSQHPLGAAGESRAEPQGWDRSRKRILGKAGEWEEGISLPSRYSHSSGQAICTVPAPTQSIHPSFHAVLGIKPPSLPPQTSAEDPSAPLTAANATPAGYRMGHQMPPDPPDTNPGP